MPPTVASTVISSGVVTDDATPIWLSAATTPMPSTRNHATDATGRAYVVGWSAAATARRAACASAAAIATTTTATAARGIQARMSVIRSLTGLGPHTPNAICAVTSSTAQ